MKILFLTHRLPYAPNRGDRIRAYHLVRTLAPRARLHVLSLVHDAQEETQADAVRDLGVEVTTLRAARVRNLARGTLRLTTQRPLTHALLDAPGILRTLASLVDRDPPDAVLAYCSGMARFALEPPLAGLPLVLDMVDVDSRKWASLQANTSSLKRWLYGREARCLGRFEQEAARRAHTTIVVNERERSALAELAPEANIRIVPNGIDVATFRSGRPPSAEATIVFCGVMNYEPNVEAIAWFAKSVWPLVVARRPEARLAIVGSDPVVAVRQFAERDRRIQVTGTVADVRPFLWDAAVSIAPIFVARGVQNKVLEALAAGLPAVVTPQVLEGLPQEARAACSAAADPAGFADLVVGLLARSGPERRAIAGRARLDALEWDRQLAPVLEIIADAARRRVPGRAHGVSLGVRATATPA